MSARGGARTGREGPERFPARIIYTAAADLPAAVEQLPSAPGRLFLGLVVEEQEPPTPWHLQYWWAEPDSSWLVVDVAAPDPSIPSISSLEFAADWPEREAEDLFGIAFAGHPQLGDFVLHDEDFGESAVPMRQVAGGHGTTAAAGDAYRPPRIVEAPGGFLMPVGPVFSGIQESVRFLLETVGEEIMHAQVRLFYKYRGVEKLMEGHAPDRALLLAERVNGTQATAHALAFATAVERMAGAPAPMRAQMLRTLLAEWERIRSHVGTLAGIVESTGLSVPANHLIAAEERLLQQSAEHWGHRYLFGLVAPGGLTGDPGPAALGAMAAEAERVVSDVLRVCDRLTFDNSFLDRLEMVGVVPPARAATLGLVGPVRRASGAEMDFRRSHPYAGYDQVPPAVAVEVEGDGYARFRVFRRELEASLHLIQQLVHQIPAGPVIAPCSPGPGGRPPRWKRRPGP